MKMLNVAQEVRFLAPISIVQRRFKATKDKLGHFCQKMRLQTTCPDLDTTCGGFSQRTVSDFIDYLNFYSYISFIL